MFSPTEWDGGADRRRTAATRAGPGYLWHGGRGKGRVTGTDCPVPFLLSLFWRLFESHRDSGEQYCRFLYLPHKFGHRHTGLDRDGRG